MSFKSICAALALTASVSHADKMSLQQLMMLQNEMVDHLDESERHEAQYSHHESLHLDPANRYDMGHDEPEVDHGIDSEHKEDLEPINEMKWDTLHQTADISGNVHCQFGYKKIGCCKCVLDKDAPQHHIADVDHMDLHPSIHGMVDNHE